MNNNEPIRILHVLTVMNRAGTETMLMNLYRNIDKNRVQFDFAVSSTLKGDYDDEILSMGGRIIVYPRYLGKNHFIYKNWWEDFFKSHPEYKIVHGHIGSTASIYLKIAKKYNCYAIAHSHSAGGKLNIKRALYKIYSYNTRNVADYFFACSNKALISRYGKKIANDENISCILRNGVDLSKFVYDENIMNEMRKELGIEDDELVIGTIGRFTDAKNPFFIVEIAEEIKKEYSNFKLIWIGDGELKSEIERIIKKKKLDENICLLGVRSDIEQMLQVMNVFILPSKFEGLPMVGVEVQAAGIPFLCSDKVSPEIEISSCIKLLPINDASVWAKYILLEKSFRRNKNSIKEVAEAGYDICKISDQLQTFYENVTMIYNK